MEGFDTVLLRHALHLILSTVRPPFSQAFAPLLYSFVQKCAKQLAGKWVKSEVTVLEQFRDSIEDEQEDLLGFDPQKASLLETIDSIVLSHKEKA